LLVVCSWHAEGVGGFAVDGIGARGPADHLEAQAGEACLQLARDLLVGSSGDLLIHLPVLLGAVPFWASFLGRSGFGVIVALMYARQRR
jgi:hypothetical protein